MDNLCYALETNDSCLLIFVGWTAVRICLSTAHSVISGNENERQILRLIDYDHVWPQEILTST